MSRHIDSAAVLAALFMLPPAAMSEEPVTKQVSVSYADLDLANPAGVHTLLRRLDAASARVCGKRPTTVRFGQLERYLDCRGHAISDAVRRIDAPAVTLAYQESIAAKPVRTASR